MGHHASLQGEGRGGQGGYCITANKGNHFINITGGPIAVSIPKLALTHYVVTRHDVVEREAGWWWGESGRRGGSGVIQVILA